MLSKKNRRGLQCRRLRLPDPSRSNIQSNQAGRRHCVLTMPQANLHQDSVETQQLNNNILTEVTTLKPRRRACHFPQFSSSLPPQEIPHNCDSYNLGILSDLQLWSLTGNVRSCEDSSPHLMCKNKHICNSLSHRFAIVVIDQQCLLL